MKDSTKSYILIITLIVLMVSTATLGILYFSQSPEKDNIGSVVQGEGYYNTSTPWDSPFVSGQIAMGHGSLNSITVTFTGDTEYRLLDATTTVAADRPVGTKATSSAEIARIKNTTVGTYTFDADYNYGLMLQVISGTTGTSTITYR